MTGGANDVQSWKIRSITALITGDQREALNRRMCSNEKIRQYR